MADLCRLDIADRLEEGPHLSFRQNEELMREAAEMIRLLRHKLQMEAADRRHYAGLMIELDYWRECHGRNQATSPGAR